MSESNIASPSNVSEGISLKLAASVWVVVVLGWIVVGSSVVMVEMVAVVGGTPTCITMKSVLEKFGSPAPVIDTYTFTPTVQLVVVKGAVMVLRTVTEKACEP